MSYYKENKLAEFDNDIIENLPVGEWRERKLSSRVSEKYGVKNQYNPKNGELFARWYPVRKNGKITGYKGRILPKQFNHKSGTVNGIIDFFGQHLAGDGGKLIILVEGEEDVLAVDEMLRKENKGYRVIGMPRGCNIDKSVIENIGFLEGFETIILALDQDEPGHKCVEGLANILSPGKIRIAKFSEKDPCDMLIKGKEKEFLYSIYNSKSYRLEGVISIEDCWEDFIKPPEWGLTYPWPSLTNLTYGIRTKEIIGLGAGVGIGKTDFAHQLQYHLVENHNKKIGVFSLEESRGKTFKSIAGKVGKSRFHIPGENFNLENLKKAGEHIKGKVFIYDHRGVKDWKEIKKAVRYMILAKECYAIFIDPLTALSPSDPAMANEVLNRVLGEWASLTHELNFPLFYFSHLNNPSSGPPHERGGQVYENQFTGSRAMMRWSHLILGLERNKDPELCEIKRNMSNCVVLKEREYGNDGEKFRIYYNKETGDFLEPTQEELELYFNDGIQVDY